eukprot:272743-Chlamydomonas_euryale.AAC.4
MRTGTALQQAHKVVQPQRMPPAVATQRQRAAAVGAACRSLGRLHVPRAVAVAVAAVLAVIAVHVTHVNEVAAQQHAAVGHIKAAERPARHGCGEPALQTPAHAGYALRSRHRREVRQVQAEHFEPHTAAQPAALVGGRAGGRGRRRPQGHGAGADGSRSICQRGARRTTQLVHGLMPPPQPPQPPQPQPQRWVQHAQPRRRRHRPCNARHAHAGVLDAAAPPEQRQRQQQRQQQKRSCCWQPQVSTFCMQVGGWFRSRQWHAVCWFSMHAVAHECLRLEPTHLAIWRPCARHWDDAENNMGPYRPPLPDFAPLADSGAVAYVLPAAAGAFSRPGAPRAPWSPSALPRWFAAPPP